MKDYQLEFADQDLEILFRGFDINKAGVIDYDEFLRIVKVILICKLIKNREN